MTEYSEEREAKVKRYMPYILATAIFMQMLDSTILNTAIPAIASDLGESPLNMQGAIISYVLTLALFIPISGYFADKFGTQKTFLVSLVIFIIGSVLCASSQSLNFLIFARFVQGLGGALMTPVARLALIKTYPRNEYVQAMNYAIIPALLGPIAGPLVGGYLVEYISWHWIFLINIPFGLLGFYMALKYLPNFEGVNTKLDYKGFLIFGTACLLLSVALEYLSELDRIVIVSLLILAGVILLYLYYLHAKKVGRSAIFPLHLFQVRTFRVGIVGNLVCRLGVSSIPLLIPLLIQVAYGRSASTAGWIIAPMSISVMATKSVVVPILDYFGYRNILKINTLIIGVIIIIIGFVPQNWNILWYVGILIILGFFNSIQFTTMNAISIADLRDHQTSSGNSLLSVNQQLSMGFGIGIGLAILRVFKSSEVITNNDVYFAFKYTFIFIGLLTILSSFVFSRLNYRDGDNLKTKKAK
ncbi:EmrB/QacA subfamily drug resistance transporter [Balneicella halophila]|uniref:EmrB/QacA subfamily drug resistance transporter n=1 Tax=Balneicella halophila TaxID=1537566 RepID=A0A7L4URD1_BALHA|nr:MFS transporter [Balneicella halophila]PVX52219.1 EmrB/QacA subfamily drug resistance transporter [Balneicella halophila]